MGPEGHDDDQRSGALLLQGKADRAGLLQHGKEDCWGDLTVAFQYLKKAYKHEGE